MLASLLNIFSTPEEQAEWSFAHQDQHMKINNAIFEKNGTELPLYDLDPMPDPKDPNLGAWAYNHQAAHTDFDGILGIAGDDLTSVDFSKQDQVESWIRLHFFEHYQAQSILGFPD
jgi:hypothetical protein